MAGLGDDGGGQDTSASSGEGIAATAVKTIIGFLAFIVVSMLVYAVALTILEWPLFPTFGIPGWFRPIWTSAFASALGFFAAAVAIKAMFRRTPRRPIYIGLACIYGGGALAWIAMLFLEPGSERDLAPLINSILPLVVGWSVLWRGNGWDELPGRSV
jgi:hypothetical protein